MAVFEATTENYDEQLKAAEYVVVDCYGDHCGSCVYLAPFFREASNDMPFIHFVKINVTTHWKIAQRYDIKGVPTLLFFHNGEIVHEAGGGMQRDTLNGHIAQMLYQGL